MKNKMTQKTGRAVGGKAVLKKYGPDHFRKIANKRWRREERIKRLAKQKNRKVKRIKKIRIVLPIRIGVDKKGFYIKFYRKKIR